MFLRERVQPLFSGVSFCDIKIEFGGRHFRCYDDGIERDVIFYRLTQTVYLRFNTYTFRENDITMPTAVSRVPAGRSVDSYPE